MTRTLQMLATCALGLATVTPAFAAPSADDDLSSRVVAVSDLNLSSSAGAEVALNRLSAAARAVCDSGASTLDLRAMAFEKNCRRDSLNSAVRQLNAPLVTIAYVNKAGGAAEVRTATR
ncbi:MAG TPA: UrcA family protein [Phenylobacterium sp.]|nr:UrcA family protein [Phenylobacterium sp.]